MARGHLLLAALALLCACGAGARIIAEPGAPARRTGGRDLLQTPNCAAITLGCSTCATRRLPGSRRTEVQCTNCRAGFKLRRDGLGKTCDCNTGFYMKDSIAGCVACPTGQYCPGYDASSNPNNEAKTCSAGLTIYIASAKSQSQCATLPGFGRISTKDTDTGRVSVSGAPCDAGSYNIGKNTAGCQRCPSGLTTQSTGANSSAACIAPAGSYMDKGIGKRCPRGTFTTDFNTLASCQDCPDGLTTAAEGANSSALCLLAVKGFYKVNATTTAPCPIGTFSDADTDITACTPCDNGLKTELEGATGSALCLAPPGWELVIGATTITQCPKGKYKDGWNRNLCNSCGYNLITATLGAVGADECLVPAGYGLNQTSPTKMAIPCERGSYGDMDDRQALSTARCMACPPRTTTRDKLTNTPRNASTLYTSEEDCLLSPGWGMGAGGPEPCEPGTYNAGLNREGCDSCETGRTGPAEASSSATCFVEPGQYLAAGNVITACDKGTWSPGGNITAPNPTSCNACPTGTSTPSDGDSAKSIDDCSECLAGRGGATCALCPNNAWSSGSTPKSENCTPCATGTVSRRGATEDVACYDWLQPLSSFELSLDNETSWTVVDGVSNTVACQKACTDILSTCIMFRFLTDTNVCQVFSVTADGPTKLGLKIMGGADYVIRSITAAPTVGELIADGGELAGQSLEQCMAACNAAAECEAFTRGADGACRLVKSSEVSGVISMVSVYGPALYSDMQITA
ncbi:SVEP1 [Scenedesmus sp. PABB004]|nr:SVEP1 [Scenedesmus sp. PABB004]